MPWRERFPMVFRQDILISVSVRVAGGTLVFKSRMNVSNQVPRIISYLYIKHNH